MFSDSVAHADGVSDLSVPALTARRRLPGTDTSTTPGTNRRWRCPQCSIEVPNLSLKTPRKYFEIALKFVSATLGMRCQRNAELKPAESSKQDLALLQAQRSQSLSEQPIAVSVHNRSDLAGELGCKDHRHLVRRKPLTLFGRGRQRRSRLRLRLPRPAERLVQQRLDRVEPDLVVGHRDLVPASAAAMFAADRRPEVLVRPGRRLEQHTAD